jgi:hypothetical protein
MWRHQALTIWSAIVYINGVEVVRSHEAGAVAIKTAPDTWNLMVEGNSTAWTNAANEGDPYTHTLSNVNLVAGENILAISGHNNLNTFSPTSSDLAIKVFHLKILSGGPLGPPIPVTLNVTDANIPPLIVGDSYSTQEDVSLATATASRPSLFANDGLFNASGQPYDPILEIATLDVVGGSVTSMNQATGHFSFTPAANFSGYASFRYRVRDKDGWSQPALVGITVVADFELSPFTRLPPLGSQLPIGFVPILSFHRGRLADPASRANDFAGSECSHDHFGRQNACRSISSPGGAAAEYHHSGRWHLFTGGTADFPGLGHPHTFGQWRIAPRWHRLPNRWNRPSKRAQGGGISYHERRAIPFHLSSRRWGEHPAAFTRHPVDVLSRGNLLFRYTSEQFN